MQSLYVNVPSEALQVINAIKGGDDLSFNGAAHCLAKWGNSYFIDVEWVDNFSDWLSKLVSVL